MWWRHHTKGQTCNIKHIKWWLSGSCWWSCHSWRKCANIRWEIPAIDQQTLRWPSSSAVDILIAILHVGVWKWACIIMVISVTCSSLRLQLCYQCCIRNSIHEHYENLWQIQHLNKPQILAQLQAHVSGYSNKPSYKNFSCMSLQRETWYRNWDDYFAGRTLIFLFKSCYNFLYLKTSFEVHQLIRCTRLQQETYKTIHYTPPYFRVHKTQCIAGILI